jgi:hypothetical protein
MDIREEGIGDGGLADKIGAAVPCGGSSSGIPALARANGLLGAFAGNTGDRCSCGCWSGGGNGLGKGLVEVVNGEGDGVADLGFLLSLCGGGGGGSAGVEEMGSRFLDFFLEAFVACVVLFDFALCCRRRWGRLCQCFT